jgi:cytochrome c-type biogenesis protein CcmH
MRGGRLKAWPSWVLLVFVVVGFLAVGAARDSGPRTPDERVEAISKRVACPVCQGESVYESRHPTSENIKDAIQDRVREGVLADDEIIQSIVAARQGQELLVPTADGVEALAWALPATAFVVGVAGLTVAFRRWQRNSASLAPATEDDFALVAEAMRVEAESPDGDPTGDGAGDDVGGDVGDDVGDGARDGAGRGHSNEP